MPAARILATRSPKSSGFTRGSSRSIMRRVIRRAVTTITALTLVAATSACGIRLETTAPAELIPDNNEVSRQAMVNDLLLIQAAATSAAESDVSKAVGKRLTAIDKNAKKQETILGSVYDSGLPDATPNPVVSTPVTQDSDAAQVTPDDSEDSQEEGTSDSPQEATDPQDDLVGNVLTQLVDSSTRIRSALALPDDPELARIYGSLAIGQVISAQRLAKSAKIDFTIPEAFTSNQPWDKDLVDLNTDAYKQLVEAEDFAGYALEVIAAMRDSDRRAVPRAMATEHRARAEQLAQLAKISGTELDPRAVAYQLPFELSDTQARASEGEMVALAQQVESDLATNYLNLVALVPADGRAFLLDSALQSALNAQAWGVKDTLFPYVPDYKEITVTQDPASGAAS